MGYERPLTTHRLMLLFNAAIGGHKPESQPLIKLLSVFQSQNQTELLVLNKCYFQTYANHKIRKVTVNNL